MWEERNIVIKRVTNDKIVDKLHAGIGHLRCGIAIKFFISLRCRDSYSQYLEITKSDVITQTKCNNEEEYFICNFDFNITWFIYSVWSRA